MRVKLKNFLRLLVINLFLFSFLFGLLEFYSRYCDARYLRFSGGETASLDRRGYWKSAYPEFKKGIYEFTPGNYKILSQTQGFPGDSFTINSNGYRIPNFNPSRPVDLAIFGDSFTFGWGVNPGERFSDLLSKRHPELNIANLGFNAGFTAPHYLLHFRLTQMAPQNIFVFSYLGNDCESDLEESVLISRKEGGYPVRKISPEGHRIGQRELYPRFILFASNYSSIMRRFFSRVYYSSFGPRLFSRKALPNRNNSIATDRGDNSNACQEAFSYLKELEVQCKERNAGCQLINFLIPQIFLVYNNYDNNVGFGYTELSSKDQSLAFASGKLISNVVSNCSKLGLTCVDLRPTLQSPKNTMLYIKNDGHWNKDGHAIVARLLEAWLPPSSSNKSH